jgi:hypothetical protein
MEEKIAAQEKELNQLRLLRMRILPVKQQLYLIWSEEHQAWWHANRHQYTRSIFEAGRFRQPDACEIVLAANAYLDPAHDPPLNEIAIPDPLEIPQ